MGEGLVRVCVSHTTRNLIHAQHNLCILLGMLVSAPTPTCPPTHTHTQRYWGEPFPIVFSQDDDTTPIPIPESSLPLVLPDTDEFKPSGTPESPLANILDWVNTTVPGTDTPARRETSTMPQWAGSCWYYLRFIDPRNAGAMVSKEEEQYWMPVRVWGL